MGKYNPFLETTEPDEDVSNPFFDPVKLESALAKAEPPEPDLPPRHVLRLPRKNK